MLAQLGSDHLLYLTSQCMYVCNGTVRSSINTLWDLPAVHGKMSYISVIISIHEENRPNTKKTIIKRERKTEIPDPQKVVKKIIEP